MRGIKLLAVLPYEGLKELLLSQMKDFPEIQLTAIVSDRFNAVKIVSERLAKEHFDMVVSRGGTAELLRKKIHNVTILDIPVGFDDIFRAVLLAQNYREKFAIVSFPSVAENAKELCDMLHYKTDVFIVDSEAESEQRLLELRGKGYTMIVGDVTTVSHAKSLGMNVVLIMTGENSVKSVLRHVISISNIKKHSIENKVFLEMLQTTIPEYVGIFDWDGNELFSNNGVGTEYSEIENYIKKHFACFKMHEEYRVEFQTNKKICSLVSKIRKYDDGFKIAIYGREVYDSTAGKSASIVMAGEDDDNYIFESRFGTANSIGKAKEEIAKCCDARHPILILGEKGCGKDTAAASIHKLGYNKNGPYFIIDYANLTVREWNNFFMKTSSPLFDIRCTIYFKNLQAMDEELEKCLVEFIENSNLCRRNQVIFSSVVKAGEEKCRMVEYLLNHTRCVLLQALPIRKRIEDLPSMATVYVNDINVQTGKQLLGLEPDALEIMERYTWPGNITQLKRVLFEAAMMTEGNYISAQSVRVCIENEIFDSEVPVVNSINLNQSLDDITYDIVRMVMKEEGFSKKKTADRLGISRTTVWRILESRQ